MNVVVGDRQCLKPKRLCVHSLQAMRTHTHTHVQMRCTWAAETPAHLERVTESRPSHAVSCPHTWSALIYWCASPIKHATVSEREKVWWKNADRWIKEAVQNVHRLGQVHTATLTKQLWHFYMRYFMQISPIIDYWQDYFHAAIYHLWKAGREWYFV